VRFACCFGCKNNTAGGGEKGREVSNDREKNPTNPNFFSFLSFSYVYHIYIATHTTHRDIGGVDYCRLLSYQLSSSK